jgi:hypothetical protein
MVVGLRNLANSDDSLRYSPFPLVTVPSLRTDGDSDPRRKFLEESGSKEASNGIICDELP